MKAFARSRSVIALAALSAITTSCSKKTPTPTVKSVAVAGGTTVAIGSTTQLTATATLSDNSTQSVTASSTWNTSAPAIASVSSGGVVQGLTAGTTSISATYQQVSSSGFGVQVTSGVQAAFTVTPDAGLGFNPGQCPLEAPVTVNGQAVNRFLCTLDASSSSPSSGITSYAWQLPEGGTAFTGVRINSGFTIPCGGFGGGGTRKVRLTIVAPIGTSTVSNDVTFVKTTPC